MARSAPSSAADERRAELGQQSLGLRAVEARGRTDLTRVTPTRREGTEMERLSNLVVRLLSI